VTTVTPPIFAVFRAVLDEPAVGDAAALAELPDPAEPPPDELPHAAVTMASAARATAAQPAGARDLLFRIAHPAPRTMTAGSRRPGRQCYGTPGSGPTAAHRSGCIHLSLASRPYRAGAGLS
jgi:hypothetical protein